MTNEKLKRFAEMYKSGNYYVREICEAAGIKKHLFKEYIKRCRSLNLL